MPTLKQNVNVKIDASVKEQAVRLLELMGIDQTTAIDMFYRQIIVERKLPFQPMVTQSASDQVRELINKNKIPRKTINTNTEGHLIIDKNDHTLYDWAVNG